MTNTSTEAVPSDDGRSADKWFCDLGGFWGTAYQLVLCARCGGNDYKKHDEPRHYAGVFTPQVHTLCDDCFYTLKDAEARSYSPFPIPTDRQEDVS